MATALIQKILRRITVGTCWEFPGFIQSSGYGCVSQYIEKVWCNGRRRSLYKIHLAHRISYEFFRGPIPSGMDVHHKCFNRLCVKPSHLELVPHKDHHALSSHYGCT